MMEGFHGVPDLLPRLLPCPMKKGFIDISSMDKTSEDKSTYTNLSHLLFDYFAAGKCRLVLRSVAFSDFDLVIF